MDNCFVIQPFDNNKFDKRFFDIFSPAINKAGLNPYRIDQDLSVRIPIEDIENGITNSAICFAEITTDNPNVWYELGFAIASGKDVILVCSDERLGSFPFDIRHRQIINYKTGSTSDFDALGEAITKKVLAYTQSKKTVKILSNTPVVPTEGLNSSEIALLILVMENHLSPSNGINVTYLHTEMSKAGYTDIATSIGISTLTRKDFLSIGTDDDYNGYTYHIINITRKGEDWIIENQHLFQFRKDYEPQEASSEDDLPF